MPVPAASPAVIPAAGATVPGGIAVARRWASASRAASTCDKHERAWDALQRWCDVEDLTALPGHQGTLAVYRARRSEGGSVEADVLSGAPRSHDRLGVRPPPKARCSPPCSRR